MDFLDWLTVLFSFGIALYLIFDGGGLNRDWPLVPSQSDDERRVG